MSPPEPPSGSRIGHSSPGSVRAMISVFPRCRIFQRCQALPRSLAPETGCVTDMAMWFGVGDAARGRRLPFFRVAHP